MQCKYLNPRTGHRVSAVCVASLLIAANDLGYSTTLGEQMRAEQVLCIADAESGFPQIHFEKGQVHYKSDAGVDYVHTPSTPANGDTISTGANGFVRVQLSQVRHANVLPLSTIKLDSSVECQDNNYPAGNSVHLQTPYLSAAIRG